MAGYPFKEIEQKWQKFWQENNVNKVVENKNNPKYYILDMFPYPSGAGLHIGHPEGYTATDIIARYKRMKGFSVLHPMGFDAFGLPTERYSMTTGIHPVVATEKNIENFKRQLNMIGLGYDWSRCINTTDPNYYKWTQWFFLLLYKNGLAYKKKAKVNWCDSCQTVLANEQAEGGICERCKNKVIQKDLEQWFFKITDFIEDKNKTQGLINGLNEVDWPESTKTAQINWIGKSEGVQFKMQIKDLDKFIEVYTTRIDTVFGMTYAVVAPEHKVILEIKEQIENWEEVEKYIEETKKKSDLMRIENKNKTGVEIKGIKVINPFNNKVVPLFVADYVLIQYGTGAVMAVPAHDERDFEFAKKYNLEIKKTIIPPAVLHIPRNAEDTAMGAKTNLRVESECFTGDGELINAEKYSGLTSKKARTEMTKWLEKQKIGQKKINYKLRDWLISRQRYWGAPIPIIYCDKCGTVLVPEKDLPVELPDDVDFKPTGESPLVYSKKFHNVKCPQCGLKARREADTMDTFVCSSWYYFRYTDPKNNKEFASKEKIKNWLPVDLYVGGAEHSVLHLLYARFFAKVLHNLGYVEFDEPFLKLRHQGIILAEDGRKMSKSLGNIINPNDVVDEFGADSLRCFEMFMGPLEDAKPWNTKGIIGLYRFLEKVWKIQYKVSNRNYNNIVDNKLEILINKTIKKVEKDIEDLKFNTAISSLMILANELEKQKEVYLIHYEKYLILLSPFAPHLTEELWNRLGNKESIFARQWPKYDKNLIKDKEFDLIVQVNGKLRDTIKVAVNIPEAEAKELVMQSEKIKKYIIGKEIKKIIFVKNRLINIVV